MIVEYEIDLAIDGLVELRVDRAVVRARVMKRRGVTEPLSPARSVMLWVALSDEKRVTPEELLVAVRRELRTDRVRIGGLVPALIRLDHAELSFDDDERLRCVDLRVFVEMPGPIPFPFVPGRVAPSLPSDPPFEEALLAAARELDFPIDIADTVETERYWLFPVRSIGSLGVIVDRRTVRAAAMGSALPREVWVWAWEQGLMDDSVTRVVLEECAEPALLREELSHVYRLTVDELVKLPLSLANDWRAWQAFYSSRARLRLRPETTAS